ncbi:unnamed protein product [Symbiodinium sp. CCMP2456]|nr:unnamed protein product [Symbiodinium sp. CCMP2456]
MPAPFTASWRLRGRSGWTALSGVPSEAPWPRLVPSTSTRAVPAASVTLQAACRRVRAFCLSFLTVQGIPRRTARSSEA